MTEDLRTEIAEGENQTDRTDRTDLAPASFSRLMDMESGPGAAAIMQAWDDAQDAQAGACWSALICGQLLREQRKAMNPSSHRETTEKSGKNGQFVKSDKDNFSAWLAANCPEISRATAYRWMEIAERVMDCALVHQLHEHGMHYETGLCTLLVYTDGKPDYAVALSRVLLDDDLESRTGMARQLLMDYCGGKTLRECLEGEKRPAAITLAHVGRTKGGAGGDRRAWEEFVGRNTQVLTGHLGHWQAFSLVQKEQALRVISSAVVTWPAEVLAEVVKAAKVELGRRG